MSKFKYRVADQLWIAPTWTMDDGLTRRVYKPGEPEPVTVAEVSSDGENYACVPGHVSAAEAWASEGAGTWYHANALAPGWTWDGADWIRDPDPERPADPWPVVAYRESVDMATAGDRRTEWRVRPRDSYAPGELERRFGRDWLFDRLDCEWVSESRTLLDGEPIHDWDPRFLERTRVEAADCCDAGRGVILLDPELVEYDRARREAAEAERVERERAEAERRAVQDRERAERDLRDRSRACFERMWDSPRWGEVARAWNDLVARGQACESFVERIRGDARARELSDAVQGSTTIASKRRAIRKALAYLEPILAECEKDRKSSDCA